MYATPTKANLHTAFLIPFPFLCNYLRKRNATTHLHKIPKTKIIPKMRLNICVNFTYISKSNSSGAQYVIPIKLDEER